MGEMLQYLLVAAFFVIVEVIAVGKKKKKRPAAKLHEPKRAAPPEMPQKQADETARERARVFEQADEADEFDDPCEQEAEPRIHLHHADEQAMEQAGEGEDPCHAALRRNSRSRTRRMNRRKRRRGGRRFKATCCAGVIMSEILTRPGERAAVRRMKRGR